MREFCGVFGIFGDERAAAKTHLGIYALQHRGQESAGIAVSDGRRLALHKNIGLVSSVFSDPGVFGRLTGHAAIGHTRYSTTGAPGLLNAQPLLIYFRDQQIAAAHNGNLVNSLALRRAMEGEGSIFHTTADSEIVLHLIARSKKAALHERVLEALSQVEGAYCFLFLTKGELIAARDPHGFRPLCLGRKGSATLVASESCAFDINNAEYVRSIAPGEVLVLDATGARSFFLPPAARKAACIFEYIYFSRPDSLIFNDKVDKIRRRLGKQLALEQPATADIVIAVPDSANTAALGYAQASGLRFEIGLIRNHYIGRTFILPQQANRDLDVRIKFNPVSGVLKDKRVVVVEDSIVRGTTLRQLVRLIRQAGAAEIHVRVSSPPVCSPCYYGIDISKHGELMAATHSVEEIRAFLQADSLGYLSVDGMLGVVRDAPSFCRACFTGDYPTAVPSEFRKEQFDGDTV